MSHVFAVLFFPSQIVPVSMVVSKMRRKIRRSKNQIIQMCFVLSFSQNGEKKEKTEKRRGHKTRNELDREKPRARKCGGKSKMCRAVSLRVGKCSGTRRRCTRGYLSQ